MTDEMDALMYLRAKCWQLSNLYPVNSKKASIDDWIQ